MADPVSIATISLVGGTALSAGGSILKGGQESMSADFERQQLQIQSAQYKSREDELKSQAETIKTAAAQAEAARRGELTSNLETIQAIRAGRGVGSASPTGMGIFDSIIDHAQRDIVTERLNYLTKADSARMEAANADISSAIAGGAAEVSGQRAKTSLLAGYLGAGADIFSAGYKYYNIQNYGRVSPIR
jgi:hypothetical protein